LVYSKGFYLFFTFGFYSGIIFITMYEYIHEPIIVCAKFAKNKITPLNFKWGTKVYDNLHTNLVWHKKYGKTPVAYFGVDDGVNYFKLMFDGEALEWWIEELSQKNE
jgi:hypothetical protein